MSAHVDVLAWSVVLFALAALAAARSFLHVALLYAPGATTARTSADLPTVFAVARSLVGVGVGVG